MIVLARLLARTVGIALMALAAIGGVVTAVFCIGSGDGTLSLSGLAGDIHLPQLRQDIGAFLTQTTAHGSVALIAALAGAGAVLLGLVLLAGCWISPRPRRIVLERTELGSIGALRRPLARMFAERAGAPEQVATARAHARARRRHDGGRVRVRARAAAPAGRRAAREAANEALAPVSDDRGLRVRIRGRRPTRRDRRAQEVSR